ncbi:MAG: hypothetical protein J2P15_23610, partial [Micromonosporaceae bacterium]|nr:hypothetical protein [Micromonosporaceae bacterium]
MAAALLAAGAVGVMAAPGYADDTVQVSVRALEAFGPGQSRTLQVQILHPTLSDDTETLQIAVTGLGGNFGVSRPQGCHATGTSTCTVDFINGATGTRHLSFTITASSSPNLQPGQADNHTATVRVTQIGGEFRSTVPFHAVLLGPQPPAGSRPPSAGPDTNQAGAGRAPASGAATDSGIGLRPILLTVVGAVVALALLTAVLALVRRGRNEQPRAARPAGAHRLKRAGGQGAPVST